MVFAKIIKPTLQWIQQDWRSHPFRFVVETLAWTMSIAAAIWFAVSVPAVPFVWYLLLTIVSCGMYAWAAWSRQSFGMLANYLLLTTIDSVGLMRILT